MPALEGGERREELRARRLLLETVLAAEPLFRVKPWFLADQFSLLDAAVAPILWRLPRWRIVLPGHGTARSSATAQRLFAHPAFRASLSEAEREMRALKSRRPYLLRAMHEWISDSGCTPHLVVDAGVAGRRRAAAVRPGRQDRAERQLDGDGAADSSATTRSASAAASAARAMQVRVPVDAVLAIYARETGQGMIFSEEDAPPPAAARRPNRRRSRRDRRGAAAGDRGSKGGQVRRPLTLATASPHAGTRPGSTSPSRGPAGAARIDRHDVEARGQPAVVAAA